MKGILLDQLDKLQKEIMGGHNCNNISRKLLDKINLEAQLNVGSEGVSGLA